MKFNIVRRGQKPIRIAILNCSLVFTQASVPTQVPMLQRQTNSKNHIFVNTQQRGMSITSKVIAPTTLSFMRSFILRSG